MARSTRSSRHAAKFFLSTLCAFTIATLAPAPVHAQDDTTNQARLYFEAGEALYKAGDYGSAVVEYKKAYELKQLPGLLFNIAQAFRLKGDDEEALLFYTRFLAAQSNETAQTAEAKDWIAALEPVVTKRRREAEKRQREIDEKNAEAERQRLAKERAAAERERRLALKQVGPGQESSGGLSTWGIAGITTASAGAIVVGVGIYYGVRAKQLESDLEREDERFTDAQLDDFARGERYENRMFALTGIGGSLIAVGAGLFVYDLVRDSKDERDSISVAPVVAPDSASIALSGRF